MEQRSQSRRANFKVGLPDIGRAQEKRRQEALAGQRARRSNTFDSIRGIEDLADCFLNDDSDDDGTDGRYEDANESEHMRRNDDLANVSGLSNQANHLDQSTSSSKPNKYRKFRNRCMRAECLDLSEGLLPVGFEDNWIMVGPVPKGKRCLALSLNDQKRSAHGGSMVTILLSRKDAHMIGQFNTNLPPGCIVDCIYDQPNQILWILDILKWKDQAMIDCEASFRFWWRDAKLSELPPQIWPNANTLLCATIPALSNFSKNKVAKIAGEMSLCSKITHQIVIRSNNAADPKCPYRAIYDCDGLLFYLKSATYESGESVLAGWVPLENSGISSLKWLCERDQPETEEIQMEG
ncbi:hypothetical protein MJO28_002707 [Puccinia striiformis f. sp. tritici]|uniref:Uncharacterized protein n=1 Tax=Puccinia striiformis f. sp. tritici TaxID=168172 RepID=A0ACC0EQG4_9BASI|nr:hypothetical protein MJO28_002707 [Puccinia striiformis f. sp. tritici]